MIPFHLLFDKNGNIHRRALAVWHVNLRMRLGKDIDILRLWEQTR